MVCDKCKLTNKCSVYLTLQQALQHLEILMLDQCGVDVDCDFVVNDCPRFKQGEPVRVVGFRLLPQNLEVQDDDEGDDEPDDMLLRA